MRKICVLQSIAIASLAVSSGCQYPGAVYTEYSNFALDIRNSVVSDKPLDITFGYDHAQAAYLPKNVGEGAATDTVSILSNTKLSTVIDPADPAGKSLLQMKSVFVSGLPAIVLAQPESTHIKVSQAESGEVAQGMLGATPPQIENLNYETYVSGDSAARIGKALSL